MTAVRPMRVAYVNHTGSVSGAEKVLIDMVRTLDRATYEPCVICPADGDLARLLQEQGVLCVPSPPVHARFTLHPGQLWKAARSLARAVAALRKTLSSLDPDIVHANTLRAGIVASVATFGTDRVVVWHIHDNLPRHAFSALIRVAALLLRPDRIITVSDSTARAFRGPLKFNGRISTIHNGTDLSRFPLKSADSPKLRSMFGIPEDAFLICAVGQICARKGLLELIDAFTIAHEQAPHMHLVIVGSVVFEHEKSYFNLLRHASSAPEISRNVHFAGHVHNVSAPLQAADLLVLNSHEEPFGLVLIEAMSSGTPVLAARVGGIPEIVRDSQNGWLVESGDTTGLAKHLIRLSRNGPLLQSVAQRALNETCPQFSLEEFRSKLHRFYAELIPEQAGTLERAQSISTCN
ncbi:MAG: glycosyltransferase family 4 protein [Terracidiphilus sp.]